MYFGLLDRLKPWMYIILKNTLNAIKCNLRDLVNFTIILTLDFSCFYLVLLFKTKLFFSVEFVYMYVLNL